jgi:two-component system copper resistance phosphate regulon response regulator CusR
VRLLVGEDDVVIREFVKRGLSEARFQVNSGEAKTALALASETGYDGFVIDLGLPGMDGLDLIGNCRAQGQNAPVLILSARRSVDDRVRGLEQGGDEYLPQAFCVGRVAGKGSQPPEACQPTTI